MSEQSEPVDNVPSDRLRLVYAGGMADRGALLMDEYTASLDGWRDLWQVLGELYLRSFPPLRRIPGKNLLRIEVTGEQAGSYETYITFALLAAAGGIIGNRADAAAKWTFRKLVEWYRDAITGYVKAKSTSTNVEEIAAALAEMTRDNGIALEGDDLPPDEVLLFEVPRTQTLEADEADAEPDRLNRRRVLAERLDHSLRRATEPLEGSCERITLQTDDKLPIVQMGLAERAVIAAPLTPPPPNRDWRPARIKFERINRKTGRALFYFENELATGHGAHYSRISDPSFRQPHNRYTQAFDNDEPLDVWLRQTKPEPGRLNLQWEIQGRNPDQGLLFDMPPMD